jgi:hypothetical protein
MHEPDEIQAHDPEQQLNHHAPAHTSPSRSPSASSLASTSSISSGSRLALQTLRSRATEAKLYPSTLGIFLVFLATLLLSYSSHRGFVSMSSLLGAGCLGVGLKILVASEDQALHLDPEHEGASVVGKERGRARGRGRKSRRHTTSS